MVLDKNIVNLLNFKGRGAQTSLNNSLSSYQLEDFWDDSYFDEDFLHQTIPQNGYLPTLKQYLIS